MIINALFLFMLDNVDVLTGLAEVYMEEDWSTFILRERQD